MNDSAAGFIGIVVIALTISLLSTIIYSLIYARQQRARNTRYIYSSRSIDDNLPGKLPTNEEAPK